MDLATKGDQRVKGELYKDQIEIVGDFYTHKSIKDSTKDNATIIVVNDISEGKALARLQLLEGVEENGDVVTWQDLTTGESRQVVIEQVSFTRMTPRWVLDH